MPTDKDRIDWMPGGAALDALSLAQRMWTGLSRQDVIDRLVITGLSAVLYEPWREPILRGGSRHRWYLPPELAALAEKAIPGKRRR